MFKRFLLAPLGILLLIALVLVFGPREPIDETIRFDPKVLNTDLDAYLATAEARIANIKPGATKQIIWHDPATRQETEYSVIYLHGFSATLEEMRPLPDLVARQLGANVFYTRLRGHGRSGAAMSEATLNDWFNDTVEALAIGRAIGNKVIVIGASTGGTLASWAATIPSLMQDVVGLTLVAPNFGVNNAASFLLTLGGARTWAPWIGGTERAFDAHNAAHGKWWTTSYPTVALLPMMALVTHSSTLVLEDMTTPALFVFHPGDTVVKSDISRDYAGRWARNSAASATVFEVTRSDVANNHVIAGRILNPGNTSPIADRVVSWVRGLNR